MHPRVNHRARLFAMVANFFAAAAASAATYYVSPAGNDSNPGTPLQPFASIQHAIDQCAAAGDEVVLADGTYAVTTLNFYSADIPSKSLELRSQRNRPSTCILDCSNANGRAAIVMARDMGQPALSKLTGLTIQNAPNGALDINYRAWIVITNCVFSRNQQAIHSLQSIVEIDRCNFLENYCTVAGSSGGAIYSSAGSTVAVLNSQFDRNHSIGAGGAIMTNSTCWIRNTLFTRNSAQLHGSAVAGAQRLTNCVFFGNGDSAAYFYLNTFQFVTNCIFRDLGAEIQLASSNPNAVRVSYSNVAGGYAGTGNIDVPPMFVRYPGSLSADDLGNLRLYPESAGINAGTMNEDSIWAFDPDGLPRALGGAPDMGAYESWEASTGMWFVDATTGSDASPGSPSQPFATVSRAIVAAAAGQKIFIAAGPYGNDRPRITKNLSLKLWGAGPARIGYSGGASQ